MDSYQFTFDRSQCLSCGVCVDVCPVRCLDMTRPTEHGAEGDFDRASGTTGLYPWMTVYPIQTGRCTGCMVCTMECPADVVSVVRVAGEVTLAPPQGPLIPEPREEPRHWQPLSAFTRMSRKARPLGDPWGSEHKWRPVRRQETWRVWRTWLAPGAAAAARAPVGPSGARQDSHEEKTYDR